MISEKSRQIITDLAREFDVKAVWLFGSALREGDKARDIDLAVEGIAPERFYRFYGRLFWELSRAVDLVDFSEPASIIPIIRETGVCIYERTEGPHRAHPRTH